MDTAEAIATEEAEDPGKPRLHPPEPGAEFNLVESVICRRRSVRFYLQKQVPEYLVRRVLEAGRFAPSAGNAQPWKYIVLQDRAMMAEMEADVVRVCRLLTRFAYYMVPGSERKEWRARLLMRLSPNNFHPIPFTAMKMIADGKLGVWHKAPTVIVLLTDVRSPGFPILDIGITGQNMVLAAHSFGLGTCWVSFVKPLAYYRKWRKRLGIRYPYKLVTSIAVGYPRGIPDGEVDRETRAIDWYGEDGSFRTVF